jgi:hypothetical protein
MPTLAVAMVNRGARINYLSLALQARSAIKRLKLLLAGNKPTPELKAALLAALNSLGEPTLRSGSPIAKLHDEVGFDRFEEIQTVEEVIHILGDSNLREEIARIHSGENYTEEDIRATIGFFSAVENRALYHYDDPSLAETFH